MPTRRRRRTRKTEQLMCGCCFPSPDTHARRKRRVSRGPHANATYSPLTPPRARARLGIQNASRGRGGGSARRTSKHPRASRCGVILNAVTSAQRPARAHGETSSAPPGDVRGGRTRTRREGSAARAFLARTARWHGRGSCGLRICGIAHVGLRGFVLFSGLNCAVTMEKGERGLAEGVDAVYTVARGRGTGPGTGDRSQSWVERVLPQDEGPEGRCDAARREQRAAECRQQHGASPWNAEFERQELEGHARHLRRDAAYGEASRRDTEGVRNAPRGTGDET
ncbi:hypothetical protein BC628DRAFT_220228 [Trametes gibbosa]|nr:hypothetical protein BC628DRAFT_220228 [Trametes gibbosa]